MAKQVTAQAQTRDAWDSTGYGQILGKIRALKINLVVYETMREALPFLDAAINYQCLLDGWVSIDEEETDAAAIPILEEFLDFVPLRNKCFGLQSYFAQMTSQALGLGYSLGEMVPAPGLKDVGYIQVADSRTICFKLDKEKNLRLAQTRTGSSTAKIIEAEEWCDYLAFRQERGHPQGYPLAFSLSLTANVMTRMRRALSNNWGRFADPGYHTHYEGGENETETVLKARHDDFKGSFDTAMKAKKSGQVVDLHTFGGQKSKLSIETWGMLKEALDTGDAWRQCAEEVMSKTGLPPWLLGLHWSTTERLSVLQAKMLSAGIKRRREIKDPLIYRNCSRKLALVGKPTAKFALKWDDVSLQDSIDIARAQYYEAIAEKARADAAATWQVTGLHTDEEIRERIEVETGKKAVKGVRAVKASAFPTEIHRNPAINQIAQNLEDALAARARTATEELLKVCNLPTIEQLETWKRTEEKAPVQGQKAPKKPTKKQFDRIFNEWYRDLTGDGLPAEEAIEAPYRAYSARAASAGARFTHAELATYVPAGTELGSPVTILPDSEYLRAFTTRGQKLIRHKITEVFKDKSAEIIAEGLSEGKGPYQMGYELFDLNVDGSAYHWERLARTESAMASDVGGHVEAVGQGCEYEQWSFAGGDCEICGALDGKVWKIGEGPLVGSDTHPNCMCDKIRLWIYEQKVEPAAEQRIPYPEAA